MKKLSLIILFTLVLFVGCASKTTKSEPNEQMGSIRQTDYFINNANINAEQHWNLNIAENNQYVFYLSENQIISLDKSKNTMKSLGTYKKDDSISLCIDTENLWVSNDKEVWKMDFEGNNKTVVVTLDDLKKVNDSELGIDGMKVYNKKIYIHTRALGNIYEYISKTSKMQLVASSVYAGDFLGKKFFYVDEKKECIFEIDLVKKNKTIVRSQKGKGHKKAVYSSLINVGENLYYVRMDQNRIICYKENGKDITIRKGIECANLISGTDDKLYYIYDLKENENAQNYLELSHYLGCYRNGKNVDILQLPDDYYGASYISGNHLYYEAAQKDKGEIVIQKYYKVLDFSR